MFDTSLYGSIIKDWETGCNVQNGLNIVYKNINGINQRTMELLSIPDNEVKYTDLLDMKYIITISNILYNNTSKNNLILEDGIYDLLVVKYKNITGDDIVGAIPVIFMEEAKTENTNQELIPGVTYLSEDENMYISNMLYHDDIYKNKILTPRDMLYPGVTYEKTVSKRLKDTSHNNPELVGTLDKAKFVLLKQAKDKGVDEDPSVNVLERDFFGKHIEMGVINPNQNIDIIL